MKNKTQDINYGINLLKFISMLGIVMIHVINQGGIINNLNVQSFSFYFLNLLYTIVIISVNVFAMITGYLYCKKENIKYKNIISLIAIVIFYSFIITFVFYGFNLFDVKSEGLKRVIYSFFPCLAGRYWYITCYILLFCMIPYLNIFIKNINKKTFEKILMILFFLLSLVSTFGIYDFFRIESGYSPFWLMYCYLVGAYINLYLNQISYKKTLLLFILLIVISCSLNYGIRLISFLFFNSTKLNSIFVNYNSPFILGAAAIILHLFSNLKIKDNKIMNFLSSTSFGVYIIHGNMLIFDFILKDRFMFLCDNKNILLIICGIFIISLLIYIICSIIDFIRVKLFKLLQINILFEKIGNKIDKLIFE